MADPINDQTLWVVCGPADALQRQQFGVAFATEDSVWTAGHFWDRGPAAIARFDARTGKLLGCVQPLHGRPAGEIKVLDGGFLLTSPVPATDTTDPGAFTLQVPVLKACTLGEDAWVEK